MAQLLKNQKEDPEKCSFYGPGCFSCQAGELAGKPQACALLQTSERAKQGAATAFPPSISHELSLWPTLTWNHAGNEILATRILS